MKQKLLLALLALFTLGWTNASAQKDVTSTYLTNPGFDDGEDGWTFNGSGTTYHGVAAYGSSNAINNATNINVDKFGKNVGNAAFSNAGWGDKSYYTQEVTLPAGSYKITFDVINRFADKTGINNNFFGWVPNSGEAVYSTTKTFEYNVWYTLSVTFTLTESTTGKISCGMQSISGSGSGAVAKLFIDNVKIFKTDEVCTPTIANPIDYSDLVNQTTWSVQQDDTTTPTTSSTLVTNITSGDWTGRYVERYRGVAGHYGKALYQTVSVPAGVYQVQAACMSSSANGVDAAAGKKDGDMDVAYFYANSEELTYPLSDKKGYYRKHIVTLDADGTIEFGINTKVVGANWNAIGCATVVKVANDYNSYIEDLLSESVAAWNTAHATLADLDADALPTAAKNAITDELAKQRPNTQAEIEAAIAAMQALIDSYEGIKAAYNEYKALKDKVENLKNKNFTGDDALSTFNNTLSDINTNAEAATDAETLTNLLPSLKTAGNTFVGGIESNDGFDLTYNIDNNSFETGALSPWTTNGSNDTGVKPNSNGTYTTTGVDGAYLFNTWNNGAGSKVSQTLSDLPRGYYTVTALVASDADNKITIMAGSSNKEVTTSNKGTFVEGITDKTLVSDGSLEIGTNSSTWYKADNFRLTFYTETAGARDAWLAAKAAAEAALANTDYANVTGSEKTELQAEINKAEPSSAVAYGTATTALQEKTSAFIAAKDSYDAFVAAQAIETPELKYASNDKKNALNDAKTATATSATDADTKTAAIITALRAYYESNAAAEGVNGAEDLTSKLTNAKNQSNTNGWTVNNTTGNCNLRTMSNEPYTYADGTTATGYLDTNSWGSAFESSVTQNVELYAGKYILSVKARGAETTIYQLTANGVTADITAAGNTGGVFDRGWNGYTVEFELEETGSVALGVNFAGEKWLSFGDFQLVQLELYTQMATDEDYAALNEAISAAEANLGFEDGQYAPYKNIEALTKLAEAKAIDQAANNEQETVQALTTYLTTTTNWTANSGDVDAIYNGTFAETGTGTNPKGWTRSNNGWGQQITGLTAENGVNEGTATAWYYNNNGAWQYGNDGVYTMPLAAGTTYMLTFKYAKHDNDGNNWMKASVVNSANEGLEVAQYPGATNNTMYQKATAYFTTGAAGNYILSIEQNGNVHLTDVSLVKAESATKNFDEASKTYTPELAYYETVSLTRSLQAGDKWNTFCVPFDMVIPEGWTVKEFDSAEGNTINFKNAESIVAGKPYIVKLTEAVTNPTYSNVVVKSTEGETMGQGDYKFAAQIFNKSLATDGSIAYMTTSGQIKKLTSGGIKGLRAYFIIPANGKSARIHFVEEDETTGIDAIDGVVVENGNIYDLQGRKVETMKRGIYIVNGKKVVIK